MTADQILALGPELAKFLEEFADCFVRSEPRGHLADYVRGQLSDLPHKCVEPIADFAGIKPRTLQEFLNTDQWHHAKLRGHVQRIIARDHADPQAIGIIDDSGHPKKGCKTACVSRQYCGNTGKVDNCVVTVHLSFASFDTRFRAMLDSTPYLPQGGWDDPQRREEAGIPDEVRYRPKYDIALEQLDGALASGMRFSWLTFDEWYAEKPKFLAGLEQRGQRYIAEVPRNFPGWLFCPENVDQSPKRVDNLCRFSRPMMRQAWTRFYVKETQKGPMIWEAKAAPFWLRRDGQILGPYWLIVVRNVRDPNEMKYFLSNAAAGTPLEVLLHVGFARWPIERCLQDEKSKLGLSDFEVRKYQSVLRHLLITQVSHLFLARGTSQLREKKSRDHDLPGPRRVQRVDRRAALASQSSTRTTNSCRADPYANPGPQHQRPSLPHQNSLGKTQPNEHHARAPTLLHTTVIG